MSGTRRPQRNRSEKKQPPVPLTEQGVTQPRSVQSSYQPPFSIISDPLRCSRSHAQRPFFRTLCVGTVSFMAGGNQVSPLLSDPEEIAINSCLHPIGLLPYPPPRGSSRTGRRINCLFRQRGGKFIFKRPVLTLCASAKTAPVRSAPDGCYAFLLIKVYSI